MELVLEELHPAERLPVRVFTQPQHIFIAEVEAVLQ